VTDGHSTEAPQVAEAEALSVSAEIVDSQGEVENHAGGGTSRNPSGLISSVFTDVADKDEDGDEDENQGHDHGPRKR
jgi:hypothetical protein